MEMALQEIPLALFTTFMPIGAGAFTTLFLVFLRQSFKFRILGRLDRLTVIPVIFVTIGLLCSISQWANPMKGLNILRTVGTTPLSNEIVVVVVFYIFSLGYWIAARTGCFIKHFRARTMICGIVTITGLLAVCLMGQVYLIPTIPVWDGPRSILELVCIWLFGGAALGLFIYSLADKREGRTYADVLTSKILLGVGALLLIAASFSIFLNGSSMTSAIVNVDANANSLMMPHLVAQLFTLVGVACGFIGRKSVASPLFGIATVCAIIASFLLRLCFYGMQIGIGL